MKKFLGICLALTFCIGFSGDVNALDVKRISGSDRYETAIVNSTVNFNRLLNEESLDFSQGRNRFFY